MPADGAEGRSLSVSPDGAPVNASLRQDEFQLGSSARLYRRPQKPESGRRIVPLGGRSIGSMRFRSAVARPSIGSGAVLTSLPFETIEETLLGAPGSISITGMRARIASACSQEELPGSAAFATPS